MFKTIDDIKNFQKSLLPSNGNHIFYYLNTIYQNLLMREETPNEDINDFNNKNVFTNTMKQKANEKGISLRNFMQYFDIQEFMCERVFNYLDKSNSGKLTKNEFVNGIYTIFFGSIEELYKMIFFMCDFINNNKIHKFNMKLLLSYIPVKSFEEQQKNYKHINSIINNYFINLDKKYPNKEIKINQEIDYDLYENSIEEYINDESKQDPNNFNNNGSFLLFINLISYIYQNHPFSPENMEYCKFIKNKFLMKIPQIRISDKNNSGAKFSETFVKGTLKVGLGFDDVNSQRERQKKNVNKEIFKDETKESKQPNQRSSSFHNSKLKKNNNNNINININNVKLSDEEIDIINGKNDVLDNKNKTKRKYSKNNVNTEEKYLSQTLKGRKGQREVGVYHVSPNKQRKAKPLFNYDSNKNIEEILVLEGDDDNKKKEEENSSIIYKFCDEDNSKYIKKYYACIQGKEILFFSSKLKNELCSIWNINKTIIITGDRTSVSKYSYYPIKFINYNNSFYILYLEEQEKQKLFANKCKEETNFLKIEDLYEFKEKIGEGHFGTVKRCIEKKTGEEYAVKIMYKNKIKPQDLDLVIKERNYLCLIKHPNIVSLIKDFEDENCLYFVMEYFKGGDLGKYLARVKDNKEKNLERIAGKIIKIIAQGVQYLNQFGIVHRDLKPENIVFGKENEIKSIKIIDLGVCITLPYGKKSSEAIGTLAYIAPEMYTHKEYTYKVDVWSIGILLYYLVTGGVLPFDDEKNDEDVLGKKVVYTHQEYPEKYFGDKSKSLISVIDKALEKNPEKRITINNFLNEEWLSKYSK